MPSARVLLLPVATILVSCKFPELPPLEDDAAVDAALIDTPSGPAVVSTAQGPHDFGPIVIGELSPMLQVTIRNGGGETTGPLSVALLGASASEFRIVPTGDSSDCVNARLAGGQTCVAQVRYAPSVNASAAARLEVSGNPGGTATVALTGDALTPADLTTTQGAYDFGDIVMGQQSTLFQVVIRNDGEQASGSISVTIGGAHPLDFEIVPTGMANDCAGATLELQETCIAQVRFHPTVAALRTASLDVNATPGGVVNVPLMGDGLSPGALVVEMPSGGSALDFGTREIATGATSATQTIRVRNTGGASTGTLDVTLTGGGASSFAIPIENCDNNTLGPNATCDVQVRFNPTSVGSQPATVTIRDTAAMTAASVSAVGIGTARAALSKSGQGTVVSNPAGINCGTGCSTQTQSFMQTPISLTATPESGWEFTSWSGSCTGSNPSNVCSLTLDQGVENVGALFTQVFVLTVSTTGSGTVASTPPGILCGNGNTECTGTYPASTVVQLAAEPDAGWEVFSWTGTGNTCNAGARTCSVTMNQARTVSVVFRRQYTLTVAKSDGGDGGASYGTVTSTNVAGITCGGDCTEVYFDGQTVTLNAAVSPIEAASLDITPWTLPAGFTCATNPCTLTITQALTATANYTIRQYDLTVTRTGNGAALGMVMRSPTGTSCGTDCTRHPYASDVTLTASASSGASFSGWTGGGCPAAGSCTVDMTSSQSVSAAFTLDQHTLTVTKSGFGSGTVTGTVPPATQVINCGTGAGCSATIDHGTVVTLVATPNAGDVFFGWSGGGCTGTGPCNTTVTAATNITATFDQCNRTIAAECTEATETYTECSAQGQATREFACPLGCATGMEKCVDVDPGNSLATYLDMARDSTSAPTVAFSGNSRIQTGDGVVFNSGNAVSVPSFAIDGNQVRVFVFKSVTISGVVKVPSGAALAIVADGEVVIDGLLDVSADGRDPGPGAYANNNCWGYSPPFGVGPSPGAGGGGRFSSGGRGGNDGGGEVGALGGQQDPNPTSEPLRRGCDGGQVVESDFDSGLPGGGGGAVQIVSRTRIRIIGSGVIDASGGGAGPTELLGSGNGFCGGGGGGSGGSIYLEAPEIVLDGAGVVLSTKGGGGAAPSPAASAGGADGGTGATAALGGTASGLPSGGAGGIVATGPGDGGNGSGPAGNGAGGGGSGGYVTLRNEVGAINPVNGAAIRSVGSVNPVRTRLVP